MLSGIGTGFVVMVRSRLGFGGWWSIRRGGTSGGKPTSITRWTTAALDTVISARSPHATAADRRLHAAALRVLMGRLPERQRLVLFLRYYADLDYKAIAAALDISPGTVGATLNAAHASLRLRVDEEVAL